MSGRGLSIPIPNPQTDRGSAAGANTGMRPPVEITGASGFSAAAPSLEISGDKIAATIKKTQLERDSTRIVQAEGKFLAETDKAIAKLDPMATDYNDKVAGIYAAQKDDVFSKSDLSTREGRAELENRLERVTNVGTTATIHAQRKSIQDEAIRTYDTASNIVFSQIRKDPAAAETYVKGFSEDAARLTSGISPDAQRAIDAKFQDQAVSAKALGYADRGNYGEAKKILDSNMGTLNPAQEQKVRYQIEAIENKARTDSARYAANIQADVSAKIADWQYSPDATAPPPVSRDDIQKMRGLFTNNPGGFAALVHQLDHAMATRLNTQRASLEAVENYRGGSIRTQAEADLAFITVNNLTGKKPTDLMTSETITLAGNFARDSGYVPTIYKAQIENAGKLAGEGANSPENQARLATATMAFDRINELAPNTKWGFADDKGSSVLLASSMAKAEQISPVEAARRVLSMAPSDNAALVARGKAFEDAFKLLHGTQQGQNAFKWTSDRVVSVVGPMVNVPRLFGGSGTPTVDPSISSEYQKRLKENFVKMPDMDVAQKATDEWLKQNYSVTQIGDRNEVVRFAPEKYFDPSVAARVRDFGPKIIDDDVKKILETNKVIPGKNPFAPNLPGYRLWADDRTAREAGQWEAAGTSPDGRSARTPVTYRIQVIDQFGNYQDVNGPRYRLPSAEEIKTGSYEFMKQEHDARKEMEQPGAAAAARKALTPDRKANDSGAIPAAPVIDLGKASTGKIDPRAPKAPLSFEEVQKRRQTERGFLP